MRAWFWARSHGTSLPPVAERGSAHGEREEQRGGLVLGVVTGQLGGLMERVGNECFVAMGAEAMAAGEEIVGVHHDCERGEHQRGWKGCCPAFQSAISAL